MLQSTYNLILIKVSELKRPVWLFFLSQFPTPVLKKSSNATVGSVKTPFHYETTNPNFMLRLDVQDQVICFGTGFRSCFTDSVTENL